MKPPAQSSQRMPGGHVCALQHVPQMPESRWDSGSPLGYPLLSPTAPPRARQPPQPCALWRTSGAFGAENQRSFRNYPPSLMWPDCHSPESFPTHSLCDLCFPRGSVVCFLPSLSCNHGMAQQHGAHLHWIANSGFRDRRSIRFSLSQERWQCEIAGRRLVEQCG